MKSACFFVVFLVLALFSSNCVFGLEIRVAPETLVLSSRGGKLTVHTDVPFSVDLPADLYVDGEAVPCCTFPDCRGNLVAQCDKESAKLAIGEFEGVWTTATVTLDVLGDIDSEVINVRK